ncbi:MAG TPA: IS200/IS605 family transposase [Terriglobales bacterium]|nr:IS200/IS605 family transposase [Terriglobales bacterium]
MSHAYARNYVHLIFGTKGRRPWIHNADRLHAYIIGIAKEYSIDVHAIGGTNDHVHLLMAMPPKLSVAHAVRVIKANSSKWMNESGHLFAWQQGYGVFSVSSSNVQSVCEYIGKQGEHHRKWSFEDEFREFLRKHGIASTSATKFD